MSALRPVSDAEFRASVPGYRAEDMHAYQRKAELLTYLDRGMSLIHRLAVPHQTDSLRRYLIRLNREFRVRGVLRRAVERELDRRGR